MSTSPALCPSGRVAAPARGAHPWQQEQVPYAGKERCEITSAISSLEERQIWEKHHFVKTSSWYWAKCLKCLVISVLMLLPDTCKLASYKYSWRPHWPALLLMGTCQCNKATSWWLPAPEHEGNQEGTLRSPSRLFTWRKMHTHENSSYLAPLSFHTVPFHISSILYKERKCSSANDVSHSCV